MLRPAVVQNSTVLSVHVHLLHSRGQGLGTGPEAQVKPSATATDTGKSIGGSRDWDRQRKRRRQRQQHGDRAQDMETGYEVQDTGQRRYDTCTFCSGYQYQYLYLYMLRYVQDRRCGYCPQWRPSQAVSMSLPHVLHPPDGTVLYCTIITVHVSHSSQIISVWPLHGAWLSTLR